MLSSGQLDTTFGYQGAVYNAGTVAITTYPDGRFLTSQGAYVTRYTPDGLIDPSFGGPAGALVPGGGGPYGNASEDTVILPDGKVVAEVSGGNGLQLTCFNPDGSVDSTFGTGGVTAPITITVEGQQNALSIGSSAMTLAALPDGRILLAGSVDGDGGEHLGIAMFLPNGTLDPSFNGNGTRYIGPDPGASFNPNYVANIAVDQNHILVFGYYPDDGARMYAFNFDGSIDASFGTSGEINLPASRLSPSLAVEPNGALLVGYFDTSSQTEADGPGNEVLLRYDSAGAPDNSFGTGGQVSVPGMYDTDSFIVLNDVALEPNGKIVIIDDDPYNPAATQPAIERLNPDGSVDTSFGVNGVATIVPPPELTFTALQRITTQPLGQILAVTEHGTVFGVVGDPAVGFGAATTYTSPSGVPTAVYDVSETAGTATITLQREGDLSQSISLPFSTDDSGGHAGINYTSVNTTVTFPAGSATTTVSIPILNDPNASPPVDIPLKLGLPTGGAIVGGYTVGDLHIDPVEGITITPTQLSSVMQGGTGSSFRVALDSVPSGNVTVPLSLSSTTPAAQLSTSSLVFTPGNALTPQAVTVAAVGSSGAAGPAQLATVTAGPSSSSDPKYNGLAGGTAKVGVYASATSPGAIEFAQANFTYDENAGKATITLNRLGGSLGTVSVHFATSDASAHVSGDYVPLSGSISFTSASSHSFSITLEDPGHNLLGDQTVDLTLSNPTGGATLGVIASATLTLHDPYTLEPGDLDPAFGIGGKIVLPLTANNAPMGTIQQSDGKIVAGEINVGQQTSLVIWRLDTDGQLDPTFGTGGIAQISVTSGRQLNQIAIDGEGRIVVLLNLGGTSIAPEVIRLNGDGSLDTSFGTGGFAAPQLVENGVAAMAIESDDSILITGAFGGTSSTETFGLMHLDSTGNLDIGFGTGGVQNLLPSSEVGTGIFGLPDGKWIVVGYYGNVVRLNADFSVDTTFGTNGIATPNINPGNGDNNSYVLSAALQTDGKVVVGGQFGDGFGIARLNADGSVDSSFGDQGLQSTDFTAPDGNGLASGCTSIVVEPDGSIFGIGYADDVGSGIDSFTSEVGLLPNGNFDPSFAENGQRAFAISPDAHDAGASDVVGLANGDVVVATAADGEPMLAAIVAETPKTVPTINWSNPADIVYGTALGSTQLDATASAVVDGNTVSVPGTFAYSPAAGTILNVANRQSLSVTFTPTDSADYSSATKTVQINVTQAKPTINWAKPANIVYGTALGAAQLDATASWVVGGQTVSVPGTFTYAPAAGTVLAAGNNQTLSVTFAPTDTTDYSGATFSAAINVMPATPTINWSNPPDIPPGTALSPAQLDATATWVVGGQTVTVPGTFVYLPPAATVLSAGADQSLEATFTPTDTTDFNAPPAATAYINVKNPNQTVPKINWTNPTDIVFGTVLDSTQLDATASAVVNGSTVSVPGTFTYSPAAGTVLSAGNGHQLSVSFTPDDTADYLPVPQTVVKINVLQATPTINWANPTAITYGTALSNTQLDATATWSVGGVLESVAGTFAYTSGAGTVLHAGNAQELSVTFTPTDAIDYKSTSGSAHIDVTQATPTINWANPAAITYGTALSNTQLDATASVAGTFTYSPAAGTILNAGSNQALAVTFTPTDSIDFISVKDSAHIDVNPMPPPPPLVTVTGVQIKSVRLPKKKTATDIIIAFSGDLDLPDAETLGNYHLAAPGKGKKSKTYSKKIILKSAVFDSTTDEVTLQVSGKLALSPAPQLRITAAGILDSFDRALDGNGDGQPGGDFVALLTKAGAQPQIMRGPEMFARRLPRFPARP